MAKGGGAKRISETEKVPQFPGPQSGGQKLNPNIFSLKLFGRFRDIPAKSRDIIQKQTTIHDSYPPGVKCRKMGCCVGKMQKNASSYRKNALSCRKMPFPAEKCAFLQKYCGFRGATSQENRRKSQEGFRAQESRTLANFSKEDIPPKKFDSLGFEGHTELFGPHPFTWKTPTPSENIRTQKFRFGFLFRA